MTRGTVCVSACTYGSVGALGGQPPRATLPMLWLMAFAVVTIGGTLYLAPRAGLSPVEAIVIAVVVILLFGSKIPQL